MTSLSFSLIFLQLLMLRFSCRLGLIFWKSSRRHQIDLWIPNFLIGCTELSGDIENSTHIKIQKKDKGDWLELREKQPAARRTRKLSISTTISFLMSAKEIKPSRNMSTKILIFSYFHQCISPSVLYVIATCILWYQYFGQQHFLFCGTKTMRR